MHGGGNTRADPVHCASGSGSGAPIQVGYREPGLNEPPWVSLSCLPGSSFRLFLFFLPFFFFIPWTRWARGFATAPVKRHTRALAFLSLHSVFVFPCQCRLCVPLFSSTELPVSFSSSYHQGYETGPLSSILAHTLRRSPKGIEPTWRRRGDIYAVTVTSGLCKFP